MNKWIEIKTGDDLPPEEIFVLIKLDDDFIGISRLIDDEWETGQSGRIPIFKGNMRRYTSVSPNYWMPLPKHFSDVINPEEEINEV